MTARGQVHRNVLTGIQRALRDVACWSWGHDSQSEDFDRLKSCGCREEGVETRCNRCGRTLGTITFGGLKGKIQLDGPLKGSTDASDS